MRYINHGYAIVEWLDATQWERVGSLDECQPLKQITVGSLFERKDDKTFIIVYSAQEDGRNLDAILVPRCWVVNITYLTKKKRRQKWRPKS
jgi:hypothetical protein